MNRVQESERWRPREDASFKKKELEMYLDYRFTGILMLGWMDKQIKEKTLMFSRMFCFLHEKLTQHFICAR